MNFTLGKNEKLKSAKLIEALFSRGSRINAFPLQLVFIKTQHYGEFPIKVGFSVPKRNVKLAVNRNRIKRLMREVYRKNKLLFSNNLQNEYIFMFIYMAPKEIPYAELEISILKTADKFNTLLLSETNNLINNNSLTTENN